MRLETENGKKTSCVPQKIQTCCEKFLLVMANCCNLSKYTKTYRILLGCGEIQVKYFYSIYYINTNEYQTIYLLLRSPIIFISFSHAHLVFHWCIYNIILLFSSGSVNIVCHPRKYPYLPMEGIFV